MKAARVRESRPSPPDGLYESICIQSEFIYLLDPSGVDADLSPPTSMPISLLTIRSRIDYYTEVMDGTTALRSTA